MSRDFDPRDAYRTHRQQDPLQDLDNMRSSAAYTHGSVFGGLAYFLMVLIVMLGRMVRGLVMLPVHLLRRRRDEDER